MRRRLRRLGGDRVGATALITVLSLIVVLGFVGVAVDIGSAYTARRTAQNAADSAAFSGAVAHWEGPSTAANVADHARAIAAGYGFRHGTGGVSVTVNSPPRAGGFQADANAVEVVIARPAPRFFAGFFTPAAGPIRARAVATVQPGGNGDGCLVALDPTGRQSILMNGNPDIDLHGCALYDNSSASDAFAMNGSATLTASAANVVGGYFHNGATRLNAPLNTGASPLNDPYADVSIPPYSPGNCDSTSTVNGGQSKTFSANGDTPYVFCGGFTANGGATVHFDPGVYVIQGGSLIFNGNTTVTGTGVTFILTSARPGGAVATLTINGGANVDLSAPVSGATSGLVFYQDRRAGHSSGSNILNGGATQTFSGALYFPSQPVTFNGNSRTAGDGCTQLLAWNITFNGDSRLANNCKDAGTRAIGGFNTVLVE
jgi:Flp pilus assembly protein TadG